MENETMKVQDIEKYYDRASTCLFCATGLWAGLSLSCLYGMAMAWADVNTELLGDLAVRLAITTTLALVFYAAYAVVRSTQARAELEPLTISAHRIARPDDADPQFYR